MASDIKNFYKNKTIFITGGSGFLGKVIIEKLLRTTEVKRIYVLIRPKQGQNIRDRIEAWKDDAVFSLVVKSNLDQWDCIRPISGDCEEHDLGISESDRKLLADEVQLVLHSAATVRFAEPLHLALAINTRATDLMMQLAKQMHQLEAFVHVSTAFSNCVIENIEERFYPDHLTCSADKILTLREQFNHDLIDDMTPILLGRFPNTYTYTKALAEQLLEKGAGDLPLCVFRPGVITGSYKEPVEGWIDNLYGPISITFGVAYGVLRVTRLSTHTNSNIVPVDYCAHVVLACAWETAEKHASRKAGDATDSSLSASHSTTPRIYNYVPHVDNMLTWGGFKEKAMDLAVIYPFSTMVWLPILFCTTSSQMFNFLAFFYHIVPGHIIDVILRLRGQKPRMIKLYKKIHKNIEMLAPFVHTNWNFNMDNTEELWQRLSAEDKELYPFDIKALNWDDYFLRSLRGMRIYLGKENLSVETIQKGRNLRKRFVILHHLLQFVLCSGTAAILWSIFKLLVRF